MAVGGLALAITTPMVWSDLDTNERPIQTEPHQAIQPEVASIADAPPQIPQRVFYIVRTEREAQAVRTAPYELALYVREDSALHHVLIADGATGQVAAKHLTTQGVEELGGPGAVTVIDLH
jgi:hypothetical protein